MNRREFLKTMAIGVGGLMAACPGLPRPAQRVVKLTVTDAEGRISIHYRPLHIIFGNGEIWHTHNWTDANPTWERGADPTMFFVDPRLEQPLVRFFEERWA